LERIISRFFVRWFFFYCTIIAFGNFRVPGFISNKTFAAVQSSGCNYKSIRGGFGKNGVNIIAAKESKKTIPAVRKSFLLLENFTPGEIIFLRFIKMLWNDALMSCDE
jgi:hypothetical protein